MSKEATVPSRKLLVYEYENLPSVECNWLHPSCHNCLRQGKILVLSSLAVALLNNTDHNIARRCGSNNITKHTTQLQEWLLMFIQTNYCYEWASYLPISGMESGNVVSKKFMTSSCVLIVSKMSKGIKSVTTKDLSSVFGKAIIINSFLGQICR